MQLPRQPKIEIRKIDQHGGVRAASFRLSHHLAKALINSRQVFDDLSQSHHRNLVRVDDELASGLLHPLAAHTEELQRKLRRSPGGFLAKGFDQLRPIKLARSLSRGDENSHLRIMTFGSWDARSTRMWVPHPFAGLAAGAACSSRRLVRNGSLVLRRDSPEDALQFSSPGFIFPVRR